MKLDKIDFFLGSLDNEPVSKMLNTIYVIIKQYIYASRCLDKIPTIEGIIKKIEDTKFTEYQIALSRNRLTIHNAKWEQLL